MKKTKILSLIIVVATMLALVIALGVSASAAVVASGDCGDPKYNGGQSAHWELDDQGVLTIYGEGPVNYTNYTSDYKWNPNASSVKSIVIGEGITSIGGYAFKKCEELESVSIASTVTSIGNYAFAGERYYELKKLTSVEFADNSKLQTIGEYAFQGCSGLTIVRLPASLTKLDKFSFKDCGTIDIWLSSGTTDLSANPFGGSNVTVHGVKGSDVETWCSQNKCTFVEAPVAYGNCGSSVTWELIGSDPNYTLKISGTGAMSDSWSVASETKLASYKDYIAEVVIEDGITSIGEGAFTNTVLRGSSASVAKDYVETYGDAQNLKFELPVISSGTLTTGLTWKIYEGGQLIISGNGETGDYSSNSGPWYGVRSSITSVVVGKGVTKLGAYVCQGLSNITSVTFEEGSTLEKIADHAFSGCSALKKVYIPASVTSIEDYAFMNCSNITDVYFYTSKATYTYSAFATGFTIHGVVEDDSARNLEKNLRCTFELMPLASGTCGDGVSWALYGIEPTYSLKISGTGAMSNSWSVASETKLASYKDNITSVTIGNGITSIGNGAFNGCTGLTSLTIPSSVTSIGDEAFRGCTGFTSLTIPSSVTSIGKYAFDGCTGVAIVTIPSSVTSIGKGAFTNMMLTGSSVARDYADAYGSSQNITYAIEAGSCGPNATYVLYGDGKVVISGTGKIADNALRSNSTITKVEIGDKITAIGEYAFAACKALTDITIPDSVETIGNGAFSPGTMYSSDYRENVAILHASKDSVAYDYCNNYNYYNISFLDKNNIAQGTVGNYNSIAWVLTKTGKLTITNNGSDEMNACPWIDYKEDIKEVVIEDVVNIYRGAFCKCTNLVSVTLPNTLTLIGDNAFEGCTSLAGVEIPSSVTSIGVAAFKDCALIENITLPDGIARISDQTFMGCTSLKSIVIPESVENGWLSEQLCGIGNSAFEGCTSLASVTIPTTNTFGIGQSAFKGCTSLASIVLGSNVNSIHAEAFMDCTSLSSVTLSPAIGAHYSSEPVGIGDKAFMNCVALKTIDLPISALDGHYSIGNSAFEGCTGLTGITIPKCITSIGNRAFYGCDGISAVWIPRNTGLKGDAFDGRTNPLMIGAYFKDNTSYLIESEITEGKDYTVTAYDSCGDGVSWEYNGNDKLITITYRGIGTGAMDDFEHMNHGDEIWLTPWLNLQTSGIESVFIGEGVTYIGKLAFGHDGGTNDVMTWVSIANSVKSIGAHAFSGNTNLAVDFGEDSQLETIGGEAFSYDFGGGGAYTVTFPATIKRIEANAFTNCYGLQTIIFATNEQGESNLEFIGKWAFGAGSELKNIVIPKATGYTIENAAFHSKGGARATAPTHQATIYCPEDSEAHDYIDRIYYQSDVVSSTNGASQNDNLGWSNISNWNGSGSSGGSGAGLVCNVTRDGQVTPILSNGKTVSKINGRSCTTIKLDPGYIYTITVIDTDGGKYTAKINLHFVNVFVNTDNTEIRRLKNEVSSLYSFALTIKCENFIDAVSKDTTGLVNYEFSTSVSARNAFLNAYSAAETILNTPSSTQIDVDTAFINLNKAFKAFVPTVRFNLVSNAGTAMRNTTDDFLGGTLSVSNAPDKAELADVATVYTADVTLGGVSYSFTQTYIDLDKIAGLSDDKCAEIKAGYSTWDASKTYSELKKAFSDTGTGAGGGGTTEKKYIHSANVVAGCFVWISGNFDTATITVNGQDVDVSGGLFVAPTADTYTVKYTWDGKSVSGTDDIVTVGRGFAVLNGDTLSLWTSGVDILNLYYTGFSDISDGRNYLTVEPSATGDTTDVAVLGKTVHTFRIVAQYKGTTAILYVEADIISQVDAHPVVVNYGDSVGIFYYGVYVDNSDWFGYSTNEYSSIDAVYAADDVTYVAVDGSIVSRNASFNPRQYYFYFCVDGSMSKISYTFGN